MPTPGPKPLPIPLPMPTPTPAYTKEDLRATLKAESKRLAAEEKKAAAEKKKKDKAAAKDAKKSPWQLEKERLEAETKVRLREIEAAHKQAKAEEKAAKKAEKKASRRAGGGGGFSLFGCFRPRGCGCGKECSCHCATPPTAPKEGEDELSYTYYPKYEPINQPTPDYSAWKTGPGPLLTQHLVYNPPRAEEAARLHSRLSGRNISMHYPVLPSLKEYEGVCEPWRRYEGWNGYGWEGDRIGEPKKPEKKRPGGPNQKPGGPSGPGKQQQQGGGGKGAKGPTADAAPKSPKTPADAKPPASTSENAETPKASEDGGSRPTTPSGGAAKSPAKGILKNAGGNQKGTEGNTPQQGEGKGKKTVTMEERNDNAS